MSISITEICNQALILVDGETISVPSSDPSASKEANLAYAFKDQVRKEILSLHTWNFAIVQQELQLNSEAPKFEFDLSYALPEDCLRVIRIDGDYCGWKVKGRDLHTSMSPCIAEYISDIQDPNFFPPHFVKVYKLALAKQFSFGLGRGSTKEEMLQRELSLALVEAKQADAREGHADPVNADVLLGSHKGGGVVSGPEFGYMGFPWWV